MYQFIAILLVSFATTFLFMPWLIPKLIRAKISGKDVNKPDETGFVKFKKEVPEMGGFGIIFGFSSGILLAIALSTFLHSFSNGFRLDFIMAAFLTVLLMTMVGILDDLFSMHQAIKATLPLFAALPLVAIRAGVTTMALPLIGPVHFGIFYVLILVPIAIAGASNVTNMLAGFNGLEAGMGLVACTSLAVIAFKINSLEALVILLAMIGALIAFLFYNWYPARVLIGDVGTLSIGAAIASAVIIGNFETSGLIVIVPYGIDFVIKAINGFPSKNWWGTYKDGKLYCKKKPISFCQWIMKLTGGISERNLSMTLILIEAVFGLIAIITVK